jgi:hypothetical protein
MMIQTIVLVIFQTVDTLSGAGHAPKVGLPPVARRGVYV